jgi:hypothetical protein
VDKMAIVIDFTTIDVFINGIGATLEMFVGVLAVIFNNLTIFLLFCFFIGFVWAFVKIFDANRYWKDEGNRK